MERKHSAGLLVFRKIKLDIEVLLVHPGGPYWKGKELASWSIPKGEYEVDENPMDAAKREFEEEIGQCPPEGRWINLGETTTKSRKTIVAWAVEGDLDPSHVKSNLIEMEWPPHTGQTIQFPEVDRAEWFSVLEAETRLHPGQIEFLRRLCNHLSSQTE